MGCGASRGRASAHVVPSNGDEDAAQELEEPSSFEEAINEIFPQSFEVKDMLDCTYDMMGQKGFTADNTIACVATSRDELTAFFVEAVNKKWGECFNCSGMAGFPTLGKTGLLGALQHAPRTYDRQRYFLIGMPLVAITADGKIGECRRPGQNEPSMCCDALCRFREELKTGQVSVRPDPLDVEYTTMKLSLLDCIASNNAMELKRKTSKNEQDLVGGSSSLTALATTVPSLAALTLMAAEAIAQSMQQLIDAVVNLEMADIGCFIGVHIHGPGGKDYIYTHSFSVIVAGEKHDLTLDLRSVA